MVVTVVVSFVAVPRGMMLVTGVESPAMAVLSGSMEPAIKKVRLDVPFSKMWSWAPSRSLVFKI